MAPRANWKGFLRLSLVTCPVALYPATSDTEKVSFNQINRKTGNRIKYQRVDAVTGEDVDNADIVKGYKVDTDSYIEVTKDELDNIALESNHTIDIDRFVPRDEIDELYVVRPYYLVPDGKVGHDAYAVIRDTIKATNKVALARLVLTNREHIVALEAREKGLVGLLLRYKYEVRAAEDYFDDIQDVKITKDMLDLAKHIVDQKTGHFKPEDFDDQYETALIELINEKKAGRVIPKAKVKTEGNVINLMDALRQSLKGAKVDTRAESKAEPKAESKAEEPTKKASVKGKKRAEGQREMLLPIEGKGQRTAKAKTEPAREAAKRNGRAPARQKRSA
jgi:DNA end-binding protein Ku